MSSHGGELVDWFLTIRPDPINVVVRCAYSHHPWRANFDAQLALPSLYEENSRWMDFQKHCAERSG